MLKQSNEEQINVFTAKVLNYFNPKFEDPEIEEELARADILRFAMRCEITEAEFMLALDLATDGKLKTEPDSNGNVGSVKLFREVDIIKLGEVKAAYIRFKNEDEQYKKGKLKIKKLLNPEPKRSPEEIKAEKKKNWDSLVEAVKKGEKCEHAFLFYEFTIKKGGLVSFVSDTDGQKIAIKEKMAHILTKEKKKANSVLFNAFELKHLSEYFEDKKKAMTNEIAFAFDRLHAMAITHVKNDKVYEWVSEQIKLKSNENES